MAMAACADIGSISTRDAERGDGTVLAVEHRETAPSLPTTPGRHSIYVDRRLEQT